MKAFGLIDCNNFFVSCERVFRPDLQKRPVVVLSSNDGCVIARSQEIKDMGIAMAVPYFQIKDKLKEAKAEVFSTNFSLYRDISKRVFKVIKSEFEQAEQYSIDESFFTIDSLNDEERLSYVREKIWNDIGVPVSVGVGPSKTIAKYANKLAKKTNQVTILKDEDWLMLVNEVRLSELWGVGQARTKHFFEVGICTVNDLQALADRDVQRLFGVEGQRLKYEISGSFNNYKASNQEEVQKSISSTGSLSTVTKNKAEIRRILSGHVAKLVTELNHNNLLTSSLRIIVYPSRYSDYALQGYTDSADFILPTQDIFTIDSLVGKLLDKGFVAGVPYKKLGLVLTGLVPADSVSGSLFFDHKKTEDLSKTLININKKLGQSVLRLGVVGDRKLGRHSRKEYISPRYTTSWNDLKRVSAK